MDNAASRAEEWGVGLRPAFVFFSGLELTGAVDSNLRALLYRWHQGEFRSCILSEEERLIRISHLFAICLDEDTSEVSASALFNRAATIDHDLIEVVRAGSTTSPIDAITREVVLILDRISAKPDLRLSPPSAIKLNFAVVIKRGAQRDDSNRYSSLEHARRALNVMKAAATGVPIDGQCGEQDYVFFRIPFFLDEETQFEIREV